MRVFATRDNAYGFYIIGEVVAGREPEGLPKHPSSGGWIGSSEAEVLETQDSKLFTADELRATEEGRRALTAWQEQDDSAYDQENEDLVAIMIHASLLERVEGLGGDREAARLLREGSLLEKARYNFASVRTDDSTPASQAS